MIEREGENPSRIHCVQICYKRKIDCDILARRIDRESFF